MLCSLAQCGLMRGATVNERHAPVQRNNKIYLAGRTGKILWDSGEQGHYLCIFASDFYLRVKDTTTGIEFVTVREALNRFYPEDPV